MDPSDPQDPGEITQLLICWRGGDRAAFDRLLPLVYDELSRDRHPPSGRLTSMAWCHSRSTAKIRSPVEASCLRLKRMTPRSRPSSVSTSTRHRPGW